MAIYSFAYCFCSLTEPGLSDAIAVNDKKGEHAVSFFGHCVQVKNFHTNLSVAQFCYFSA